MELQMPNFDFGGDYNTAALVAATTPTILPDSNWEAALLIKELNQGR